MTQKMPPVVSANEWDSAREELLVKEKEATRARDVLAAERRRLPMVEVENDYAFEGPDGDATLLDLFDGRRQLIVYRFFFEPGVGRWPEAGCVGCSLFVDNVGHFALPHLHARDTSLVLVSPAPQADIQRLQRRMGCDGDQVFRSYFTGGRAAEAIGSVWSFLDLTALGRQGEWEDSPEGHPQDPPYSWWRLHDEYGGAR